MSARLLVGVGCMICLGAVSARGDSWDQFRGPMGNGVADEANLPSAWSAQSGIIWSVPLPRRGNSSPVVAAGRVFLTTQTTSWDLFVLAFDAKSGRALWKQKVGRGVLPATSPRYLYERIHNAATPTPAATSSRVVAFFGTGLLVCLDAVSGQEIWRKDLQQMYGRYNSSFGTCASPRIHEDTVYVSCVTAGTSYVAAIDLDRGSVRWKRDRVTNATGDARDSFSSPAFIELGQSRGLLVSGADWINAYDLGSGEELWRAGGLRIRGRYRHSSASPAAYNDFIIAASGNPSGGEGRVMAFRTGGRGDITGTQAWTVSRSTPDSTSPVAYRDHVFMVSDKGIASCVDLATGQVAWRYRLGGGKYYSSPVAGDGKVYFLSNEGRCTVFAAQAKGKTLAINELPGWFFATPAIGEGRIYLRSNDRLYAMGSESTTESPAKNLPKSKT